MKYARQILLAQDRLTLKYYRPVLAELNRTAKELAADYLDSGEVKFESIGRQHQSRMNDILLKLVRQTGKVFLGLPAISVKDAVGVVAESQIEMQIYSMLAVNALSSSGLIADATIAAASAVILQQMQSSTLENPVYPAQIAKAVANKIGGVNARSRAMTITRTETHNAANMAQYERAKDAAGDAELDVQVEWIATNDGRVRDSHKHADGQKQPIGTPFNVGGDKMRYPGDRAGGSPENTINCRCVLGYHIPEEST